MTDHKHEKVDGIDRYYQPIERLDSLTSIMFWVSAVLSVIVLYGGFVPWVPFKNVATVLFTLCVISHLSFTLYLRFNLIPFAEEKRRKQLLSNSFGVPLTPEETKKYYNNQLAPSVRKLGANILENSLYAKRICGRMAVRERKKIFGYFACWLIAVFWRDTPIDFLVTITQTVFSGELIARLVSLELLRHKNEDLFEELYHEFLHQVDFNSHTGTACILDAFASYEAAKAAASLKQSTKIFNKMNEQLILEWAEIRSKLGIDN
jgi:hypothetical protein